MKIFNWVHKRFHHSTLKDGLASNVKNIEPAAIISNADSQALMKQVALGDLLGGWKDGILTIGTLGCDPLKIFNQNREYYALESEDGELEKYYEEELALDDEDKYNAEHEELNPLMQTTFEHNFEDDDDDVVSASKEEVAMPVAFNKLAVVTTAPPVISHAAEEAIESVETDEEKKEKKKKGERITLADLFYADSDVKMKMDSANKVVLLHEKTTSTLKAKHGLSFTKKLIPLVKDNPHPIKDIKKLMKKMLKRKIHPELDVKNHKAEGSAAGGISSDDNDNDKHMDDAAANDTASLLPINLRC